MACHCQPATDAERELYIPARLSAAQIIANRFVADSDTQAAFLKTTSRTAHAATIYQASKSGPVVALNVASDNPDTSTMYVTGSERHGGTIKIAHRGHADGSDTTAAGLSIDLKGVGTAAQGIYVTATDAPTSGSMLTLRNNGRDELVVRGNGRVGVGLPVGAMPWARAGGPAGGGP